MVNIFFKNSDLLCRTWKLKFLPNQYSLNVRYESLYEFSLLTAKAGLQVIVQLPPCLLFHNLIKSKIIKWVWKFEFVYLQLGENIN